MKNIGEGYAHNELPFAFKYNGDRIIRQVVPDCGCTSLTIQGPLIKGNLKLPAFPDGKRLQGENRSTVRKRIVVTFDHGDDDYLYVVATLKDQ